MIVGCMIGYRGQAELEVIHQAHVQALLDHAIPEPMVRHCGQVLSFYPPFFHLFLYLPTNTSSTLSYKMLMQHNSCLFQFTTHTIRPFPFSTHYLQPIPNVYSSQHKMGPSKSVLPSQPQTILHHLSQWGLILRI